MSESVANSRPSAAEVPALLRRLPGPTRLSLLAAEAERLGHRLLPEGEYVLLVLCVGALNEHCGWLFEKLVKATDHYPRPRERETDAEVFGLRESDPAYWTWRQLQEEFGFKTRRGPRAAYEREKRRRQKGRDADEGQFPWAGELRAALHKRELEAEAGDGQA